jgi:decaprenylphospho-beta-D-erythro-pentofuranosid-2-ulose 2-reductase
MKRIVIIGATSGIAAECAKIWVLAEPVDLTLVGRNLQRLERIADDLKVHNPNCLIRTQTSDFIDPEQIQRTAAEIGTKGAVDAVLIAHGSLPEQADCQGDLTQAFQALQTNAVSPVLFAEAFAAMFEKTQNGTIAIIGSVAGDRGRKSNYVYGAAKGLVDRYAQGLQHRFAGSNIRIILVKPGPTETPMTAHLKAKGARLAPAEDVAADIVRAMEGASTVTYTPAKWKIIMLIIRNLPSFIFNKLNI